MGAHNHAVLTGRAFFPHLISGPFRTGLHETFLFAMLACLVAAAASALRGGHYRHAEEPAEHRTQRAPSHPIREEQHAG